MAPPNQLPIAPSIKEESGIIELSPIKEDSGIITISPIKNNSALESSFSLPEEKTVPHPLPSISSLEARLADIQKNELKDLDDEDDEDEGENEPLLQTESDTIEAPPQEEDASLQEEVATSRLKKTSQRLKKATQRLQQGTRRVVKTFMDYLDEEEKEAQDTRYIAIHDINKKTLTTPPPPPQNSFKKATQRLKKASQRLKKKTQKMIKIFYEEQVHEVPKPPKEENTYGTVGYWYKADESAPRKQKTKVILPPPPVDKPLESNSATPKKTIKPGLKSVSKSKPQKKVIRKVSWEGFELASKNTGPTSETHWLRYLLGIASFFLFLWSLDLLPKARKTYVVPANSTKIVRTLKPTVPSKTNESKKSSGEEAQSETALSGEPRKQEQVARVLQIYQHSRFAEEESLKGLLEQNQVTLETIDRFPPEKLAELEKDELNLLLEYQYKQRCLHWAEQEIQAYESFNFENKSALLTKREDFLKRKAGIVPALLSALSQPNLSFFIHQELSLILGLTEETGAYRALVLLFEEEIVTEKRVNLVFPLIKIGKAQAIPKVLELLKQNESKLAESAKSFFAHFAEKGNEKALEPLLYETDVEIVNLSKAVLLQIRTKEAQDILTKAHLAGKIEKISFENENKDDQE